MALPVIDLEQPATVIEAALGAACRDFGFFYIAGHGVPAALIERLTAASKAFFALPHEDKMSIAMAHGGRAWRGYFPVGQELTSGLADQKEGLYFGAERPPDGRPLHGPNLFFAGVPELRETVLAYIEAMTTLGRRLMGHLAGSLALPNEYFDERYTSDPLVLFRIFHYPPLGSAEEWSVGAHSDYGLLTMLAQDDVGGLQIRSPDGWIDAPPIPGTFVCNLGDMLDRLTGGVYRSTLHRVRNTSDRSRLSFPFFLDPGFDTVVEPLPRTGALDDADTRWDGESVRSFEGTYGDYLLRKVGRVFPDLVSNLR